MPEISNRFIVKHGQYIKIRNLTGRKLRVNENFCSGKILFVAFKILYYLALKIIDSKIGKNCPLLIIVGRSVFADAFSFVETLFVLDPI